MRRLEITRKDPRRDAKKRGGDTIYYGGDVWEAFTKKDDKDAHAEDVDGRSPSLEDAIGDPAGEQ